MPLKNESSRPHPHCPSLTRHASASQQKHPLDEALGHFACQAAVEQGEGLAKQVSRDNELHKISLRHMQESLRAVRGSPWHVEACFLLSSFLGESIQPLATCLVSRDTTRALAATRIKSVWENFMGNGSRACAQGLVSSWFQENNIPLPSKVLRNPAG